MLRDLRYALRSLNRSPGFVLAAVLCLGIALALNTTSFAILDAVIHPSLPVKDVDRLAIIDLGGYGSETPSPSFWNRYQTLRQGRFYEELAFYDITLRHATTRAGDKVREEPVIRVSGNFFPLLGLEPGVGRRIEPASPDGVAMVSHDLWERALGGAPLEGLRVWVDGAAYRVLGVLPADWPAPVGIWIRVPRRSEESGAGLEIIAPYARLKAGWTPADVSQELETLTQRLAREYGRSRPPAELRFVPLLGPPPELKQIHFAMTGAALLVLLIACANLASLMLVRGMAKRRELALRLAMGAGRGAIVRQLLAESALIALVGAAMGLLLTIWAVPILQSRIPPRVAQLGFVQPHVSWRVFAACLSATVVTLLVFGVWPAIRASDVDVAEPLKSESGTTSSRVRAGQRPLVIVEIMLSLTLLMGAGLLTKAVVRLTNYPIGYDATGLWDALVTLGRRDAPQDSMAMAAHELRQRVLALPRIQAAALISRQTPVHNTVLSDVYDGGRGRLTLPEYEIVCSDFLRTVGIPVNRGRDFIPGDEETRSAIVDETAAYALWPGGHAVGRRIKLGDPTSDAPWVTVVGVAPTISLRGPLRDPYLGPRGTIYVTDRRATRSIAWLVVRLDGAASDPQAMLGMQRLIRDVLPPERGESIQWVPWLSDFDAEVTARGFLVRVFSGFSAFALVLAGLGVFSVISYGVTLRVREFAVRIALGAERRDVFRLVLRDGAIMLLAGVAGGAFLAMWAARLLKDWLYTVPPSDVTALVAAEVVLLTMGFLACLTPARRAARANPVEILRAI